MKLSFIIELLCSLQALRLSLSLIPEIAHKEMCLPS